MKQKHIDAARETRLWLGQIVIPLATMAITTLSIPNVREAVSAKAGSIKDSIKKK